MNDNNYEEFDIFSFPVPSQLSGAGYFIDTKNHNKVPIGIIYNIEADNRRLILNNPPDFDEIRFIPSEMKFYKKHSCFIITKIEFPVEHFAINHSVGYKNPVPVYVDNFRIGLAEIIKKADGYYADITIKLPNNLEYHGIGGLGLKNNENKICDFEISRIIMIPSK